MGDDDSRLSAPSNLESPLMQEGLEPQQSGGSPGTAITACKKVLRSASLLESTDYWLQNQRTPCQIGFVEEKSEDCASVCFVNLDVKKDACNTEHLQEKLVNVSPDLPKLISSMNVQQPKENEIVLLSGLASGNLQADFQVSQCPWLPDICLVQCARGSRANSTNCIIFEINKFLIGLELVQERQLHVETNIPKLEEDTNCSLSSIEEDFLTASEHLEEENEVEESRIGYENIKVSTNVLEVRKPWEASSREWGHSEEKCLYDLEDKYFSKHNMTLIKSERSLESIAENKVLQNLEPPGTPSQRKDVPMGNGQPATNYYYPEQCNDRREKSQALSSPTDAYFSMMGKKDVPSPCGSATEKSTNLAPGGHEHRRKSLPSLQDGEATTGEYATNLAESVLQDAFIRLSQSQPVPPQEPSVHSPGGSPALSSGYPMKDRAAPRSWNELPTIVIVQSPDGGEAASEPGSTSWLEMEDSVDSAGLPSGDKASRHPQSALEVALACAATVIGTISSPQATERLTMEQDSLGSVCSLKGREALQAHSSPGLQEPSSCEYSFPSALCGMTQVASAIAVCGLGEREEVACPVSPRGLLPTAAASEATGQSMELGKEAIAEGLLREAALVLARPDAYGSIADVMESMNRRIRTTASKPQTLCSENLLRNELAQTLSNIILKYSFDEAHQKNKMSHLSDGSHPSETLDALMESTTQLLHHVMCFTVQKMSHLVQHGPCPTFLSKENIRCRETDPPGCQTLEEGTGQGWTKATEGSSGYPLSNPLSTNLLSHDPADDMNSKQDKSGARPGLYPSPTQHSGLLCSHRVLDASGSTAKASPKEMDPKRLVGGDVQSLCRRPSLSENECRAPSEAECTPAEGRRRGSSQETEGSLDPNAIPPGHEVQANLSMLGGDLVFPGSPAPSTPPAKHGDIYCLADFAEELAETVVSMATEIAAICLDNSSGKQPWFCAWKRGNEFLVTPNVPCRSLKRKKDSPGGGNAGVRKHKPPRLSEIKRKTDEHPELKEKLMNRVMDESLNLDDVPDSVSSFANEVAAKIMNLTEFSVVDGVWQGQSCSRSRLLGGDRWNRLKASSCESIPEEDSEARAYVNSLGFTNTLSQPVSRASSVSKQSSCESITDEFSRFMVSQMEHEGRGFELLLDYYAGKNASSILSAALHQACRRNDHLSVRPSCPSKQSSTESITEEFYRYMLRDIEREGRDAPSSRRGSQDWSSGLLSPSVRSPLCYRQSSVPDSRSPGTRLTVNAPIKANSLDGFSAQNSSPDMLSLQPVGSAPSSGLCKSDSCLYRRGGSDQITNMLIHETWASSIEALMRKNKIIVDPPVAAEAGGPLSGGGGGALLRVEKGARRSDPSRGCSGPALHGQDSVDHPSKDPVAESPHTPGSCPSRMAPLPKREGFQPPRERPSCHNGSPRKHSQQTLCSRDVPLIQIQTDQREESAGEPFLSKCAPLEESKGLLEEEKAPDVNRGEDTTTDTCRAHRQIRMQEPHSTIKDTSEFTHCDSLEDRAVQEAEVSTEARGPDEFPSPPSSSEESTGSWSQLANEEENQEDTSSFLQLSERSMSELVEEKEIHKGQSESIKEHASGLPGRTASHQRNLLVINFDLEPECPDAELRATLQWIAASELGIPTIYFKKSQESRIEKFLDVVRLVHQKSWKVGDIFHAVVQYCKMHEEQKEGIPSLFDWLLELG
ncbi:A-kinase anchor protein SPHKAP isoform X2 [Perognathus longimembris pacificus]|uniref:A-kinase anchor protein SPHKAP isoform X2 n=1 Tax=Perognathus longimembris pacificus TaxID=214514 RepID=UPI0020191262|nr:A-kinase anchor protein SPHKAP isoform X2 [Perognathus longimembris pacificus]